MRDECPSCGGKKLRDETLCEGGVLVRLAGFRGTTADQDGYTLWQKCTHGKRPIRIKKMDRDSTVYEVDRLMLDELRELDIFYEGKKYNLII